MGESPPKTTEQRPADATAKKERGNRRDLLWLVILIAALIVLSTLIFAILGVEM